MGARLRSARPPRPHDRSDPLTPLREERDAAFDLAHRATDDLRYANAVIRDGFLTAAEQAARMNAYIECLDRETP